MPLLIIMWFASTRGTLDISDLREGHILSPGGSRSLICTEHAPSEVTFAASLLTSLSIFLIR